MNDKVMNIISNKGLTHEQKLVALAKTAENMLDVLHISKKTKVYLEKGAICDLNEGNAPFCPRYIMPDYKKAMKQGVKFLRLDPPKDFDEAIYFLMVLYNHVPSITSFPVFLGNLDDLLEPFCGSLNDEQIKHKLRHFLNYLDRTITDAFCHANIGPKETRVGNIILELEKELQNEVPNFSLKYDADITPDEFAQKALITSLSCANPAICNHKAHQHTYKDYGISSCYNILPIGGGSYTLVRLVLPKVAKLASNKEQFFTEVLPDCLESMADYMKKRVCFLVEQTNFFTSNFLAIEGLIDKDKFLAMFGIVGLAECANMVANIEGKKYGSDQEVDDVADEIMCAIEKFIDAYPMPYSKVYHNKLALHAQVGIDSDYGISAGVRIPVGDEPKEMFDHLRHSARFHRFFPTGCSDIFAFDSTGEKNPAAMLDVVKGAFALGDKYISFYSSDSDLVRVTGYLAKRSDMEKYYKGDAVLHNTTQLGGDNYRNAHLENRKVRGV